MADNVYCYPDTNILINKLNIRSAKDLFNAEKELTAIRLRELQETPIIGQYDFEHLREIHKYIFQDLYDWAGEIRKVEIGKGNMFCTTPCIESFGKSVFDVFYKQCFMQKDNKERFIYALAENYGNLNALHPFREGNGRTQREFTRLLCEECGYIFDLHATTHSEMLEASMLSFDKADNSLLRRVFKNAVIEKELYEKSENYLNILTADDMVLGYAGEYYNYYSYDECVNIEDYNNIYKEKTVRLERKNNVYTSTEGTGEDGDTDSLGSDKR